VEVITKCLNAGKDVYSEKPSALTSEEAWKLVALAQEKGRRFGCTPITMLSRPCRRYRVRHSGGVSLGSPRGDGGVSAARTDGLG
jgi:predicted dehydrogenase